MASRKKNTAADDGEAQGSRALVPTNAPQQAKLVLDRQVRTLPCVLTDQQMAHRGKVCGERMAAHAALEKEFETVRKRHKADVDELEGEITELGTILQTGSERREVQCELLLNWEESCVETVRMDTGEIVESRVMTPEERQRDMFRGKRKPQGGDAQS